MFAEDFIKIYDEEGDVGYLLDVDVEYSIKVRMSHKYLLLLPEKIKNNKCTKLACNLNDKENLLIFNSYCCIKTSIKSWFSVKKVHSAISFRQEALLKPDIDLNTELIKNSKNEFEKDFYKLKNNSIYGKTVQNERNHRGIKLVATEYKRNKLASETNY